MANKGDLRAQPLSDADRKLIERLFSNPLVLPAVFKQWLVSFLGPEIQVTQSQVVNSTTAIYVGTGTPEGAQAAGVGSVFLRTDGSAGTTIYVKESGSGTNGWVGRDSFTNGITISDGKDVSIGGGTGSKLGQLASKLGFFGSAPVAKPSAYTQTYATADKTLNPASTIAFTGQTNAIGGSVYAKSADLEQLRGDMLDIAQMLNAAIDDLQSLGLLG